MTGASASGVPYKGVGVTRTTATEAALSPGETTTFVNVFRLVGPGPGNDLHVLAHPTSPSRRAARWRST